MERVLTLPCATWRLTTNQRLADKSYGFISLLRGEGEGEEEVGRVIMLLLLPLDYRHQSDVQLVSCSLKMTIRQQIDNRAGLELLVFSHAS